jgi:hypothetical protein
MRFTFVILLFCCFGADAQMIIKAHANYRPLAQPLVNLLLDNYPNAAAAYSLRKLDKDYTGSAIRVRRSNDNSEQNIGFTSSGDLDTASLKTFVGANSGFVTTFYNQADSAGVFGTKNATNSTAAQQPRIVNAGTVERQNGKPAIVFSSNSQSIAYTNTKSSSVDFYNVFNIESNTGILFYSTTGDAYSYVWQINSSSSLYVRFGTPSLFINAISRNPANRGQVYTFYNIGQILTSIINANLSTAGVWDGVRIGGYPSGFGYLGKFQEHIQYNTSNSSNRTGIQNNINAYYSIY